MPNAKEGALVALAAALIADPMTAGLRDHFRETLTQDPLESVLLAVLAGSYLFYQAEKDRNPKVTSFADALVFVSTSLSVGYSDIFPRTEKGKLIATALQTFGPAMSARALDAATLVPSTPPAAAKEPDPSLDTQKEILKKLDAILEELKSARASTPGL